MKHTILSIILFLLFGAQAMAQQTDKAEDHLGAWYIYNGFFDIGPNDEEEIFPSMYLEWKRTLSSETIAVEAIAKESNTFHPGGISVCVEQRT